MMLQYLRSAKMSPVWLILRVYLGYSWITAGIHKLYDPAWMISGEAIQGFWVKAVSGTAIKYSFYKSFLQFLIDTNSHTWFAKLIVFGELLTGIALILGVLTVFSASVSALMNMAFMLAGSASTNPVLYTIAILILIAGASAYRYGIDHYLLGKYYPFKKRKPLNAY